MVSTREASGVKRKISPPMAPAPKDDSALTPASNPAIPYKAPSLPISNPPTEVEPLKYMIELTVCASASAVANKAQSPAIQRKCRARRAETGYFIDESLWWICESDRHCTGKVPPRLCGNHRIARQASAQRRSTAVSANFARLKYSGAN